MNTRFYRPPVGPMRRCVAVGCAVVGLAWGGGSAALHAEEPRFDENLSAYRGTEAAGAIAVLAQQLERTQAKLDYEKSHGYLRSLLEVLNVPVESQLLVGSKTSAHGQLISPRNPRALYFNDSVSIAYVPSAPFIEVAAADPKLGVVFYTLEQKEVSRPRLVRDNRCLECHAASQTLGVPGLLARSFLTGTDGDVEILSGITVNHRTPMAARWGGYYVTGPYGAPPHRGNRFGLQAAERRELPDVEPYLDAGKYLAAGSDMVALMVFDHQMHMHNLLVRLNAEANDARRRDGNVRAAHPAAEAVIRYLLFVGEAPVSAPLRGNSGFARWFAQQGPRDERGRSLREFDLETRLFKFPCSYMIYSPSFSALPSEMRRHVYRRLWDILSGEDTSSDYHVLNAETRAAIREILIATKPDLPVYWRL